MTDEKQLQEKYLEFQMLQQQMEQLSKYLEELSGKIGEFNLTKENIKSLGKAAPDTESLISVAPGIFAKGELKENEKFVINVGANILVEKTIPQIEGVLDKQIKEIEEVRAQLDGNLIEMNQKMNSLIKELS
ncbi:prefoldin subunit alpha [Candidatus Woesearchaeota archaeon]|nr:prefoldin subunit alpha [Candidatus Woesearchaeota archaeon]